MNEGHLEFCASPLWRQIVEEHILPDALGTAYLGDNVIEIGPGPGFTTDVLLTMTKNLTAVEIDSLLADALAGRMAGTNVRVVRGDATALDFPDGSFTGAASFHMLHHIPTAPGQDRAFAEIARVLQPGGTFVAADGVEGEDSRAFHEGDDYNPIDPNGLEERLVAAGFRSIELGLHELGWYCNAVR